MSKDNSGDHNSYSEKAVSAEEALRIMGPEAQEKVEAYKSNPNSDTYFHYRDILAQFKSLTSGEKYIKPRKYHDIPMSDIYMKHNSSRNMNFFVGVLSRFKRKCLWNIPTMQVGVDKGTYYFGYHPEFYKYYPIDFCLWALAHEAHHILQDHIPRLMRLFNAVRPLNEKKITKREEEAINRLDTYSNIAADESVNSLLDHNKGHHKVDRSGFISPSSYGHEDLWSYEEYLNSWMMDSYTLFNKKKNGGSSGMGSGHSTMESAMGMGDDAGGESGDGDGKPGKGDVTSEAQTDFEDVTGSNGHSWIKDIQSGKSSAPSEKEKAKVEQAQKEAKEKGIPVDDILGKEHGKGKSDDAINGEKCMPSARDLNDLADSLAKQGERVLIETVRDHSERGGRGLIPGNYIEKYEEITAISEMHWTEKFEAMISDPKDSKETYRINKFNRNNAMLGKVMQYGFKEDDPKYNIWISMDTSYSMNKADIEECLVKVQGMVKSDTEISVTLCEFDTAIHRISTFDQDSEILKDVVGRGGTDFNCVFEHLSTEVPDEDRPDLHIILTDGGAPPPREEVRIPVHQMPLLWVLTSHRPDMWFDDNYGEILRTEA